MSDPLNQMVPSGGRTRRGGSLTTALRPKKALMTSSQASAAAKKAGMTMLSVAELEGCKELGDYITQLGAIPIGRSYVVLAAVHTRSVLAKCEEILSRDDLEPEVEASLISSQTKLIPTLLKVGTDLIDSTKNLPATAADEVTAVVGFAPRQPALTQNAVKVDIHTEGDVTVVEAPAL